MTLEVVEVSGDTSVSMNAMGPGGVPLHATVYSGMCSVQRLPSKLLARRTPVLLGFYPDGVGPFLPRHSLMASVELSLAWFEVVSGNNGGRRRYGVAQAKAQLVEDRSNNKVWPYVSFTALGGSPMQLNYRLTVHEPVD